MPSTTTQKPLSSFIPGPKLDDGFGNKFYANWTVEWAPIPSLAASEPSASPRPILADYTAQGNWTALYKFIEGVLINSVAQPEPLTQSIIRRAIISTTGADQLAHPLLDDVKTIIVNENSGLFAISVVGLITSIILVPLAIWPTVYLSRKFANQTRQTCQSLDKGVATTTKQNGYHTATLEDDWLKRKQLLQLSVQRRRKIWWLRAILLSLCILFGIFSLFGLAASLYFNDAFTYSMKRLPLLLGDVFSDANLIGQRFGDEFSSVFNTNLINNLQRKLTFAQNVQLAFLPNLQSGLLSVLIASKSVVSLMVTRGGWDTAVIKPLNANLVASNTSTSSLSLGFNMSQVPAPINPFQAVAASVAINLTGSLIVTAQKLGNGQVSQMTDPQLISSKLFDVSNSMQTSIFAFTGFYENYFNENVLPVMTGSGQCGTMAAVSSTSATSRLLSTKKHTQPLGLGLIKAIDGRPSHALLDMHNANAPFDASASTTTITLTTSTTSTPPPSTLQNFNSYFQAIYNAFEGRYIAALVLLIIATVSICIITIWAICCLVTGFLHTNCASRGPKVKAIVRRVILSAAGINLGLSCPLLCILATLHFYAGSIIYEDFCKIFLSNNFTGIDVMLNQDPYSDGTSSETGNVLRDILPYCFDNLIQSLNNGPELYESLTVGNLLQAAKNGSTLTELLSLQNTELVQNLSSLTELDFSAAHFALHDASFSAYLTNLTNLCTSTATYHALINAVDSNALKSYSNSTYVAATQRAVQNWQSVLSSMSSCMSQEQTLVSNLDASDQFINSAVVNQLIAEMKYFLKKLIDLIIADLSAAKIGQLNSIWDIWNGLVRQYFCIELVGSMNAFWFFVGIYLVFSTTTSFICFGILCSRLVGDMPSSPVESEHDDDLNNVELADTPNNVIHRQLSQPVESMMKPLSPSPSIRSNRSELRGIKNNHQLPPSKLADENDNNHRRSHRHQQPPKPESSASGSGGSEHSAGHSTTQDTPTRLRRHLNRQTSRPLATTSEDGDNRSLSKSRSVPSMIAVPASPAVSHRSRHESQRGHVSRSGSARSNRSNAGRSTSRQHSRPTSKLAVSDDTYQRQKSHVSTSPESDHGFDGIN